MSEILDQILEEKHEEIRRIKKKTDHDQLRVSAGDTTTRNFLSAIRGSGLGLIAEIKPKAPSVGPLTELDPKEIARVYQEESGVACVSVLTDEPYFGMTLEDFRIVREILDKPVLRKEFIVDPVQVYRSALVGADAILLIASMLERNKIRDLHELARELNLRPLVEVHSYEEWEQLPFEPELIGINNRTLEGDFSTDLSVTERLSPKLPDDTTVVSESGIHDRGDLQRLGRVDSVEAVLVGTGLLKDANDPEVVRSRVRSLGGGD